MAFLPLGALSSSWDDELALDLAFSVESHADATPAQQALEQQVGNALAVRHEIGRTLELVMTRLGVDVHTQF